MPLEPASRKWLLRGLSACIVGTCFVGSAAAQSEDKPPFYDTDPESESEEEGTAFSGSITSTSFYFSESGNDSPSPIAGVNYQNASPMARIFSELRLQLRADHISGGKIDFRADVRGRANLEKCDRPVPQADGTVKNECLSTQSGVLGGQEADVRELHVTYRDTGYQLRVGRQFMTEIGAIKFDGVRFEKPKGKRLAYLAFAGLYPTRGSRDLREDYPKIAVDPANPDAGDARLLPIVAGAGASYRRPKLYGAVGAAAILPRGNNANGLAEKTRILVSSNGYWQQSEKTDIFHNIIVDAASDKGAGISNIAVGVNHRPTNAINVFAELTRVDTETLNVHAQTHLDVPDANAATADKVQNNWYVSRVAQESGRLGASSSFLSRRFQLTVSGALRRRPEIVIRKNNEETLTLADSQAVDIHLQFVDRHSFKDARISASVTRSFDLAKEAGENRENEEALDRATSTLATLSASKELQGGKGEVEINMNYVLSEDQKLEETCGIGAQFLECYGTSKSSTLGLGALVFYRPDKNWFAMGMLSAASQKLTTNDGSVAGPAPQPAVLMITAFARLAYRF